VAQVSLLRPGFLPRKREHQAPGWQLMLLTVRSIDKRGLYTLLRNAVLLSGHDFSRAGGFGASPGLQSGEAGFQTRERFIWQ
jgi:hypothetical protein